MRLRVEIVICAPPPSNPSPASPSSSLSIHGRWPPWTITTCCLTPFGIERFNRSKSPKFQYVILLENGAHDFLFGLSLRQLQIYHLLPIELCLSLQILWFWLLLLNVWALTLKTLKMRCCTSCIFYKIDCVLVILIELRSHWCNRNFKIMSLCLKVKICLLALFEYE